MPDCMRELDARGLRRPCSRPRGTSLSWASASVNRCCFDHSEGAMCPASASSKGGAPLSPTDDGGCRRSPPEGAPHGLERGLASKQAHPMWASIPDGARFYYAPSYYVDPADPAITAATTDYGIPLPGRWRRLISSPSSSTRKERLRRACNCCPTSCAGTSPGISFVPFPSSALLPMLLIPAIDLKDGHCVRLKQGAMDAATVFSEDPLPWPATGSSRGAPTASGRPQRRLCRQAENEAAIKAILAGSRRRDPVQLGGGIRDLDTIERPRRRPHLCHHRHRRGQEPRLPARRLHRLPQATSSSASTPRTARWRWMAGQTDRPTSSTSPKIRDYGVEGVIYPTSAATACSPA